MSLLVLLNVGEEGLFCLTMIVFDYVRGGRNVSVDGRGSGSSVDVLVDSETVDVSLDVGRSSDPTDGRRDVELDTGGDDVQPGDDRVDVPLDHGDDFGVYVSLSN